jgi:hypothetical protein
MSRVSVILHFELSMPDKKREFNNAVHKVLGRRKSYGRAVCQPGHKNTPWKKSVTFGKKARIRPFLSLKARSGHRRREVEFRLQGFGGFETVAAERMKTGIYDQRPEVVRWFPRFRGNKCPRAVGPNSSGNASKKAGFAASSTSLMMASSPTCAEHLTI